MDKMIIFFVLAMEKQSYYLSSNTEEVLVTLPFTVR